MNARKIKFIISRGELAKFLNEGQIICDPMESICEFEQRILNQKKSFRIIFLNPPLLYTSLTIDYFVAYERGIKNFVEFFSVFHQAFKVFKYPENGFSNLVLYSFYQNSPGMPKNI